MKLLLCCLAAVRCVASWYAAALRCDATRCANSVAIAPLRCSAAHHVPLDCVGLRLGLARRGGIGGRVLVGEDLGDIGGMDVRLRGRVCACRECVYVRGVGGCASRLPL